MHGTEHVLCGPSTYPVTGTALRAWTGSMFGAFSAVPATGTAEKGSLVPATQELIGFAAFESSLCIFCCCRVAYWYGPELYF